MGFKNKVTSNTSGLNKLIRRVSNLGEKKVEAGYYENQIHPRWGLPLSTIALINERGYFGIPARNFMWQSFWNFKEGSNNTSKYVFSQFIYHNRPMNQLLHEVGEQMTDSIKWTIGFEGVFMRNSEATISYKGFNYPLVNTGYLKNHSKYTIYS